MRKAFFITTLIARTFINDKGFDEVVMVNGLPDYVERFFCGWTNIVAPSGQKVKAIVWDWEIKYARTFTDQDEAQKAKERYELDENCIIKELNY